jgi:MoaA/NifB/PqqE/SkfB family radical SAM enzyme
MLSQHLANTFNRYKTLKTHKISALPVVILMPHSACNCRCIMCDIWKDNKNLRQLTEADVSGLMISLKKLAVKHVAMSGGEALLNPNFFKLCAILKKELISITLLTTGLTLKKHATSLLEWVDEVIVSLDGDEPLHDAIRHVPGAFHKLKEGVQTLKSLNPQYRIKARTVIHRLNFRNLLNIIREAHEMGVDQISFLPADVSSQAFNRDTPWDTPKQNELLVARHELMELLEVLSMIPKKYFDDRFIAESPQKIKQIYQYYAAFYRLSPFPFKKCNAPWVSTVIEADGAVRPCFFHDVIGNIRDQPLTDILNSKPAINFRKQLDVAANATCVKCVCSLNLSPSAKLN